MSVLDIILFGRFTVRCGEQLLTGLLPRKVQEMFCYLMVYRDRPHPREQLADLLWGDSATSTAQSKSYLRKTLWQLQTMLDSQAGAINSPVLLVEPEWVQVNPQAELWLDVAVFEQVFTLVHGVPGRELDPERIQSLQGAVNLYRGDLLEGWYQDWCVFERERLQQMYLAMLDKLMGYCEAHRDCEAGVVYGTLILRYDKARERTHRRLMRLHHLSNNRTAALRQFERCVVALDEELGVRPANRTVALCDQIRRDQLGALTMFPSEASAVQESAVSPLPEVLDSLRRLQGALVDVQRQIEQDIQAVELALSNRH